MAACWCSSYNCPKLKDETRVVRAAAVLTKPFEPKPGLSDQRAELMNLPWALRWGKGKRTSRFWTLLMVSGPHMPMAWVIELQGFNTVTGLLTSGEVTLNRDYLVSPRGFWLSLQIARLHCQELQKEMPLWQKLTRLLTWLPDKGPQTSGTYWNVEDACWPSIAWERFRGTTKKT